MQGTIIADTGGSGVFTITATNGFSCSGNYDPYNPNPTITVPVNCNGGQSGTLIATRDNSRTQGTAILELEDGITGEFLFGEISASDQAAFLGSTFPSN